jgi:predicted  nucleic acid-binding Zn-ribbon protein
MKPFGIKTTCAGAVVVALCFSSTAQAQSSGDAGPPQNAKQCHRFLNSVDAALVWENKRFAKAHKKLAAKRDSLRTRSTALAAVQADIDARMAALQAAIEDEANPPSDEDANRMVDEYNALIPTWEANARSLQTMRDKLDGLTFEFTELRKTHRSNVRSTLKYRKQVATYCKRFKR